MHNPAYSQEIPRPCVHLTEEEAVLHLQYPLCILSSSSVCVIRVATRGSLKDQCDDEYSINQQRCLPTYVIMDADQTKWYANIVGLTYIQLENGISLSICAAVAAAAVREPLPLELSHTTSRVQQQQLVGWPILMNYCFLPIMGEQQHQLLVWIIDPPLPKAPCCKRLDLAAIFETSSRTEMVNWPLIVDC